MTRTYNRNGVSYTFTAYPGNNSLFTVKRGDKIKTARIVEDSEFTYKLQKSQIRARDGAAGLFEFIDRALFEHFMECLAWKVLDWIADDIKEACKNA